MQITLKRDTKKHNSFNLTMKDLTLGKLECIKNALEQYETSVLAPEILYQLNESMAKTDTQL